MATKKVKFTGEQLDGHILVQLPSRNGPRLSLERLRLGLRENENVSADKDEIVEALSRLISEGRVIMEYVGGIVFRHT